MNVGSGSTPSTGDEMLDAAQTLANLNPASGSSGGASSSAAAPSFKPPIGVPSSNRRGRGVRGSSRGSGRGRGRGGRIKTGESSNLSNLGETHASHEEVSEEGEELASLGGSAAAAPSGIPTGVRTIAIGDKVYPESFFDEILNLRKLELLQDPEILALLKKVQRKNPPS